MHAALAELLRQPDARPDAQPDLEPALAWSGTPDEIAVSGDAGGIETARAALDLLARRTPDLRHLVGFGLAAVETGAAGPAVDPAVRGARVTTAGMTPERVALQMVRLAALVFEARVGGTPAADSRALALAVREETGPGAVDWRVRRVSHTAWSARPLPTRHGLSHRGGLAGRSRRPGSGTALDCRERCRNRGRPAAGHRLDGRPAMKMMSFTTPVLIAALTVAAIWGLGMLAVRSSAASTQTSIDLLRMNLEVARLHEGMIRRSQEVLASQVEALLPPGAVPSAAAGPREENGVPTLPELEIENAARPWPDTATEP